MTKDELKGYEFFDLHDMLVATMKELRTLENTPRNTDIIKELKEQLLVLQNAIILKRLEL
jgi:hypothetical protein